MVGLNFSIKITVIVRFNITRSTKVRYLPLLIKEVVFIMSLYTYYIWKTESAFNDLKFNPTIVTYLLFYTTEER